jgi:hypothetical protein
VSGLEGARLVEAVEEEARRLHSEGVWPDGFEASLAARFARIVEEVLEPGELAPAAPGAPSAAAALAGEARRLLARARGRRPGPASDTLAERFLDLVPPRLAGIGGRVCHGEVGTGALLARLLAAGLDAYGVRPGPPPPGLPERAGLEVVQAGVADHLARLAPGGLGGLVLSGVVERCSGPSARRLAALAARALAPGGRLLLASRTPLAVAFEEPAALWRPAGGALGARSWTAALGREGFSVLEVVRDAGAPRPPARRRRGGVAGAAERVARLVLALGDYLVVAERPA